MDKIQKIIFASLASSIGLVSTSPVIADTSAQDEAMQNLLNKINKLENQQKLLKGELNDLINSKEKSIKPKKIAGKSNGFIKFNSHYSYDVLDPLTNINSKQQLILEKRQAGEILDDSVILGGSISSIVNYHTANFSNKFGYLMRHPTANNQRGKNASEAVIHSSQLGFTSTIGDSWTVYGEALYEPEQSFASGETIVGINRNQIQLRQAYLLYGNKDKSPFYGSLGKMATPFGNTDTVNPFTSSSVWHSFGGIAYGAKLGYVDHGFDASLMAVQGGAQFRAHNSQVDGSAKPSKLNNYVIDISKSFTLKPDLDVKIGSSYTGGSTYCTDFPVVHFGDCSSNNPAYDIYGNVNFGKLEILGEFAKTTEKWPGTFNSAFPEFEATKVTAWSLGAKRPISIFDQEVTPSLEFSRFISGPEGAPWRGQDQWVVGLSKQIKPNLKLFGEYVVVDGYTPLNFLSGTSTFSRTTHSEASSRNDVFIIGATAAF